MTTASAVTPASEPVQTAKDRSIDLEWEIGERNRDTLDDSDDIVTQFAVLSCSHDRERKQFYATLLVAEDEDRGRYKARSFRPFDSLLVCRQPIARFSANRLMAFQEHALAVVRANADDPHVQAKFRGEHEMPPRGHALAVPE